MTVSVQPKILIVDDQFENLLLLRKQLEPITADIVTAQSGIEALTLCQQQEFAMMLMDVEMPHMNGFAVARLFQDAGLAGTMPILFVTGFPVQGVRMLDAYRVGVVDVIQKPYHAEILLSKVRIFLELYNTRRRLEQMVVELAAERDRAETAYQIKCRFLATMSHEIRTPMHGILGFADLLATTNLTPQQAGYVETITSSGQGLLTIINDILDFSKIEAGRLQLEEIPFNLTQLLHNTLQLFMVPVRKKGLEMVLQTFPNVPELLKGDPHRLRQILYNLLGNALKFTEAGRIALFVEPVTEDDLFFQLRFTVNDTGIGIPPEALSRIMEPFVQADDSTTRKFGGTGLGLSIVIKLVELMDGGPLEVESVVGQGSSFRFAVRLAKCTPGESMATAVTDQLKAEINFLRHRKILLVEHDDVSKRLAAEILRVVGVGNVVLAEQGQEALEKMTQESFDLILTGCDMPVMDGFALTREIRGQELATGRQRVPIIALSANVLEENRHRCFKAGLDGFLSKPFTAESLLKTMHDCLLAAAQVQTDGVKSHPVLSIASQEHEAQLRDFLVKGRQHMDRLQAALKQSNWSRAVQGVLNLKVMAVEVGAESIKHKAVRLKLALQAEDHDRAAHLMGELTGALDGVEELLKKQEDLK
ncbi:MAG: response regulator [Magnetococcus sp. YQC-5]